MGESKYLDEGNTKLIKLYILWEENVAEQKTWHQYEHLCMLLIKKKNNTCLFYRKWFTEKSRLKQNTKSSYVQTWHPHIDTQDDWSILGMVTKKDNVTFCTKGNQKPISGSLSEKANVRHIAPMEDALPVEASLNTVYNPRSVLASSLCAISVSLAYFCKSSIFFLLTKASSI